MGNNNTTATYEVSQAADGKWTVTLDGIRCAKYATKGGCTRWINMANKMTARRIAGEAADRKATEGMTFAQALDSFGFKL